jgi:hypothetical protein
MNNSEQRNRKTRAHAAINSGPRASPLSPLQRLARRFQEQLFEYNETHSNVATVKWAARRGVKASCSSIARFRRWFVRRRMREDHLAFTREMIAQQRRDDPHISEEELARFGRKVFARLAIDAEDGPEWSRQQLVRQREIRLELELARVKLARQKFEFDAAAACLKHFAAVKVVVNSSGLTEPQKIERIHQAMWGKPRE